MTRLALALAVGSLFASALACSSSHHGPSAACDAAAPRCGDPGPGCRWVGPTCGSCGHIECGDGGTMCDISCVAPPPGCSYVPDGRPCSCGTLVCDDAGVCLIDCPAPPPGCAYEGPVTCDPPSCGTLVCSDPDVVCGAGEPSIFPTFDRSCMTDADCFIGPHMTDCCGSLRAMGVSNAERARFDAAEATCEAMYPACGCFSNNVMTDDGLAGAGIENVRVRCGAGTCSTFFASTGGGAP